jgi:hypothetical protein
MPMMIGTCHVCGLEIVEVMELSFVAVNSQNDPPLAIIQTFQLCNHCFMEWWNGILKLDLVRKEVLV